MDLGLKRALLQAALTLVLKLGAVCFVRARENNGKKCFRG